MSILDRVKIASPCPVLWEAMQANRGTDASRFCLQCKRNVHDIASMTAEEAEKLLTSADPVCVQIFRRHDGKVMTRDCGSPIPLTASRPRGEGRSLSDEMPAMRGYAELVPEVELAPEPDVDERARKRASRRDRMNRAYEGDE